MTSDDDEQDILREGIGAAFGTLHRNAARDFTLLDAPTATPGLLSHAIEIFDCELDGNDVPLLPSALRSMFPVLLSDIGTAPGVFDDRHLALVGRSGTDRTMRIIVMTNHALSESIFPLVADGERIHFSELRLLKQMLCGQNLSEAASTDSVSHETKRSQYKSLARKLRARSQSDLTARVMTQIILHTRQSGRESETGTDAVFANLVRRFIPSARMFHIPGPNDRLHRFIDVGPVTGRPVIMLHSQVLPDLGESDFAALDANALRFVIPMRNGALAPGDPQLTPDAHMEHAHDGIELARTAFCGAKVHIMACISGGAYGIQYAARHPEKIASFTFAGACVRPNTGMGTAGRLRFGLINLATRNWAIYSRVIDFYGQRIKRPGALEQLLFNVYRPSASDLAIIRAEHGKPHEGERMRLFFSESVQSIKHDFYHQTHPRWDDFPHGLFPTHFLHGTADFIHKIADVEALAASMSDVDVIPVSGAGQLLYNRHFPVLAGLYGKVLDSVSSLETIA